MLPKLRSVQAQRKTSRMPRWSQVYNREKSSKAKIATETRRRRGRRDIGGCAVRLGRKAAGAWLSHSTSCKRDEVPVWSAAASRRCLPTGLARSCCNREPRKAAGASPGEEGREQAPALHMSVAVSHERDRAKEPGRWRALLLRRGGRRRRCRRRW